MRPLSVTTGSVSPFITSGGTTEISIAAIRCSVVAAVPSALEKTSAVRTSTGLIFASARAGKASWTEIFCRILQEIALPPGLVGEGWTPLWVRNSVVPVCLNRAGGSK
jgi:hypothetical protein